MEENSWNVYNYLKFCPECGKELDFDPTANQVACYLHGNFEIRNEEIVWTYTKHIIKRP